MLFLDNGHKFVKNKYFLIHIFAWFIQYHSGSSPLKSLVCPGPGYEPVTLQTGGEHPTTVSLLLFIIPSIKLIYNRWYLILQKPLTICLLYWYQNILHLNVPSSNSPILLTHRHWFTNNIFLYLFNMFCCVSLFHFHTTGGSLTLFNQWL